MDSMRMWALLRPSNLHQSWVAKAAIWPLVNILSPYTALQAMSLCLLRSWLARVESLIWPETFKQLPVPRNNDLHCNAMGGSGLSYPTLPSSSLNLEFLGNHPNRPLKLFCCFLCLIIMVCCRCIVWFNTEWKMLLAWIDLRQCRIHPLAWLLPFSWKSWLSSDFFPSPKNVDWELRITALQTHWLHDTISALVFQVMRDPAYMITYVDLCFRCLHHMLQRLWNSLYGSNHEGNRRIITHTSTRSSGNTLTAESLQQTSVHVIRTDIYTTPRCMAVHTQTERIITGKLKKRKKKLLEQGPDQWDPGNFLVTRQAVEHEEFNDESVRRHWHWKSSASWLEELWKYVGMFCSADQVLQSASTTKAFGLTMHGIECSRLQKKNTREKFALLPANRDFLSKDWEFRAPLQAGHRNVLLQEWTGRCSLKLFLWFKFLRDLQVALQKVNFWSFRPTM